MNDKPFRILGIQQVAIGGPDKQRLKRAVGRHARPAGQGTFVSERENVDEDICAMGRGATRSRST
jgi:lactoylglutathione lyase